MALRLLRRCCHWKSWPRFWSDGSVFAWIVPIAITSVFINGRYIILLAQSSLRLRCAMVGRFPLMIINIHLADVVHPTKQEVRLKRTRTNGLDSTLWKSSDLIPLDALVVPSQVWPFRREKPVQTTPALRKPLIGTWEKVKISNFDQKRQIQRLPFDRWGNYNLQVKNPAAEKPM